MRKNWIVSVVLITLTGCGDSTTEANNQTNNTSTNNTSTNNTSTNNTTTNNTTNNTTTNNTTNNSGGDLACTTAELFAGNPDDATNVQVRPAEGTGILDDPAFPYRNLVFTGNQIITHQGQEIWRVDANKTLRKIAGTESTQQALTTGPCASARFSNIFGIALASDGSLFVSDQTSNAVLKITDPLGANCSVSHFAGSTADIAEGLINPENLPNQGNADGAGSGASFRGPERLSIDANDNLYLWDGGNDSMRKITPAGVVSTLLTNVGDGGGSLMSQVVLNNTLYVFGKASNDLFLTAVPTAGGASTDILRGRADIFGGSSSDSQILGGIVSDGQDLILFFNGQLFVVSATGTVSEPIAGTYRPGPEGTPGYDPFAAHSAAELQIPDNTALTATAGAQSFLAIDSNDDLYITANRLNRYIVKVACAR
jgi:hypothetical protein